MDTVLFLASVRALPDPAGNEALLDLVPPERREKLLRLRQPEDRRRSFGAWLLLRAALEELGAEPGPLAYGPQGKPFFPDRPELHFNLSHSGETVLCALSPSPVGCDVETISSARPELAARFFHPAEREILASLPEAVGTRLKLKLPKDIRASAPLRLKPEACGKALAKLLKLKFPEAYKLCC